MMMIGGDNQGGIENEGGGSSSAINNGGGGEGGLALKKGPWTAAEDAVLADYVRSHGEGNWNAVQKNTGLARCGKSCRLRWANHLRPNLKKGAFSPEEERIIVELHAKMGNKWARMATQLPGRTDNEIKNYWNTRVKRRQRQGLPLYPPELKPLYSQHHQNHHNSNHSPPITPIPSSQMPPLLSPSSTTFSYQTPTILTSPTTQALYLSRSTSHPLLHNPYPTTPSPPCLQSPGAASTTTPLPSPSTSTQNYAYPFPSPHTKLVSSPPPLFDSSTSVPSLAATNSTIPDPFFFPRASPYLQTPPPLRFKRFRRGDGGETNNNSNNMAVNGSSSSTTSSFEFPVSSLMKCNSAVYNPTTQNYSSFSLDPNTLEFPRSHFDSGQFISIPGYVHPPKTELPSNQILSQYGTSDVTFDANKENNTDHHNHLHEQQQQQQENLWIPIGGTSGLLEDMLEEAQVMGGGDDVLRRQNCLEGFSSSNEGGLGSGQFIG